MRTNKFIFSTILVGNVLFSLNGLAVPKKLVAVVTCVMSVCNAHFLSQEETKLVEKYIKFSAPLGDREGIRVLDLLDSGDSDTDIFSWENMPEPVLFERQPDERYLEGAYKELDQLCESFEKRMYSRDWSTKLPLDKDGKIFKLSEYPNIAELFKSTGMWDSSVELDFQDARAFRKVGYWHVDNLVVLNLARNENITTAYVANMPYLTLNPKTFNFKKRMMAAIRKGQFAKTKLAKLIGESEQCASDDSSKAIDAELERQEVAFFLMVNQQAASYSYNTDVRERVLENLPLERATSGKILSLRRAPHTYPIMLPDDDETTFSGCRVFANLNPERLAETRD